MPLLPVNIANRPGRAACRDRVRADRTGKVGSIHANHRGKNRSRLPTTPNHPLEISSWIRLSREHLIGTTDKHRYTRMSSFKNQRSWSRETSESFDFSRGNVICLFASPPAIKIGNFGVQIADPCASVFICGHATVWLDFEADISDNRSPDQAARFIG